MAVRDDDLLVRTRPLAGETELVDMLPHPEDPVAWIREGEGLVGWGTTAVYRPSGAGRFAAAETWWREFTARLRVHDEVGLPGTGPVAFVSAAFAERPGDSVLIVPRVIVGRRAGTTWMTRFGQAGDVDPPRPVSSPGTVRYLPGAFGESAYRKAVAETVARIRSGTAHKVVLAHDELAVTAHPLDPRFLLQGLAGQSPDSWLFAVDGLVGATPELLLRQRGRSVWSRLLAGTSWRDDGRMDVDGSALLTSDKDLAEHRYVVESLVQALRPYCAELTVPATPSVLTLRDVAHLASQVSGRLHGEVPLLRLAEQVHPTAAVGGTPTHSALPLIAELEAMDRGRYSGPVGWVDAAGDGELGVALRCAQLDRHQARLFAGCGIVADSDPDREVAEAAAKFRPIRSALAAD